MLKLGSSILPLLIFAVLSMSFLSSAEGSSGYWRVIGTLENVVLDTSCEKSNVKMRFRSRWANGQGCPGLSECPWGPSWGETTTDSRGRFSKTSGWLTSKERQRDILIEAQNMGTWVQIKIVENINGMTPRSTQGNTWTFNLNRVRTTLFDCRTELTSVAEEDGEEEGNQEEGNQEEERVHALKPMKCGLGADGKSTIDLEVVSTMIRYRGSPHPLERVDWDVTIRNNGTGTYLGKGNCQTIVRVIFTVPESGGDRIPYDVPIPELGPGESVTFTKTGNFGELSDEQSNSYNVRFLVDPDNKFVETNEQNNLKRGCYQLIAGTYSEGPCTAARVISGPKKAARKPPSKKRATQPSRTYSNRFFKRQN